MDKELFLGVYWWSKERKNLRYCIEKLLTFLVILKDYKPDYFANLYGKGWSKKEALSKKLDFSYDSIKVNLFGKRIKDEKISDIGFMASIWNGKDDFEAMSIRSSIGYDSEVAPNNFMIELPTSGPLYEYYKNAENLRELLEIMIDYWKPDYVKVNDGTKKIYPPFENIKIENMK